MADDETKSETLAEDRTDFAEDRTVMAMERTFAGWMRTAFAAIGIGIAFRGLFGALEPTWVPQAIATLFILSGAMLAASAERRAHQTFERLSAHHVSPPGTVNMRWTAYATIFGAVVLVIAVWTMTEPQQ